MNKALPCTGAILLFVVNASAEVPGLRLYEVSSPNAIWQVDVDIPDVINPVPQDVIESIAGFEFGQGVFYAPNTNNNTDLFVLQPGTGTLLDTITMTFPAGGDVITSLEFVGGTLYGGFTTEFVRDRSSLVTINPATGLVDLVGAMGIDSPTGGLAYDGSTMYTVNSGAGGPATLYTVSLLDGSATAIDAVLDAASGAAVTLTGLEFGTDGVLYGLGRGELDQNTLFSIDPNTALATRLGLLGSLQGSGTSFTTIPEPGSLVLLAVGLALGAFVVRRKKREV